MRSESCFVAIVSGGLVVDASCAMPRVCFSGRGCTKGKGDIMGRIARSGMGYLCLRLYCIGNWQDGGEYSSTS